MSATTKQATIATTVEYDGLKEVPLSVRHGSNGNSKSRSSRWTMISAFSALIIVVFVVDCVLLGQNDEARFSFPSGEALDQLRSFFEPSRYLGFDCLLSAVFVVLICIQLARRKTGSKCNGGHGAGARRAPSLQRNKPGSQQRSNRNLPDGARNVCNVSVSGLATHGRDATTTNTNMASLLNKAIDSAAREGDLKKASRVLLEAENQGEGPRPDIVSYNLLIRAYAKKCDFRGAEEWLARMENKGFQATVCSYNTVLDACAKADNADACEAWLSKMVSNGVEPNVISYATAIYARARRGEEALAEGWLKKMLEANISPDEVCYNSLIHACGVCRNAGGAERWIEEMQARGLEANVTAYTAVIDACAKCADVARAEKWLDAMIAAKVEPNVVSFSAMIDACAKMADPARAEHWHNRMVECNIKPNAHSYSAVINACAKAGNVSMAEEWLGRSEKAGVASDVVIYSSVIDACSKVGDAERATAIFRRMQSHGIKPHIVSYAALARPYAHRGDWKEVERIAGEMATNRVIANEYFIYAQILSYATARPRQAQRAEACFREALRIGLKANDHVISALVRAVGRERCEELMQELCNGRSLPAPRQGGNGGYGKQRR